MNTIKWKSLKHCKNYQNVTDRYKVTAVGKKKKKDGGNVTQHKAVSPSICKKCSI